MHVVSGLVQFCCRRAVLLHLRVGVCLLLSAITTVVSRNSMIACCCTRQRGHGAAIWRGCGAQWSLITTLSHICRLSMCYLGDKHSGHSICRRMTSNGGTDQACNVADPLSRLPVQGACESAVLFALGVMTRGQSRAQGGSQGRIHQSDSDMSDADVGQPSAGNADEAVQGYDFKPEQSDSSIAGDGSGFKEQVCAAYRGHPNFVNSECTKQLVLKDGIWFKDQTLVVPKGRQPEAGVHAGIV